MLRDSALPCWTIARPTSIWGPYFGTPYRAFFSAVLSQRYLHARGRKVHKTMGYVSNTVQQLLSLAANIHISSGLPYFLGDAATVEIEHGHDLSRTMARSNPLVRSLIPCSRRQTAAHSLRRSRGGPCR